nr:MAG TPA: hypothetical protein [Caudoviricetes sp.]
MTNTSTKRRMTDGKGSLTAPFLFKSQNGFKFANFSR